MNTPVKKPGTKKAKRTVQTRPGSAAGPGTPKISIRMYDVGFGDCFLLTLKDGEQARKVLFDCGTIKYGSMPIKDVAHQVIEDVRDPRDNVPRIDVVVCTHRHKDHVSGFNDPAWASVEVGEVWLPWTEDPADPEAKRIREVQSRLAVALELQLKKRSLAARGKEKQELEARLELAVNALSNEGAMRTLHQGFAGKPKRLFLAAAESPANRFESGSLPGVTVYVLGPWRDEGTIRDMDPPAGQSYLRMVESLDEDQSGLGHFWQDWKLDEREYIESHTSLLRKNESGIKPFFDLNALLSLGDRRKVKELSLGFDELAAAALDQAVNGTSLMLVLEFGGVRLLFPGDAQWGTWKKALESPEASALLSGVTFYKVGHHGSHNATPVSFIEKTLKVGQPTWAMISTNFVSNWPNIPKAELLEAFKKKAIQFVRSDRPRARSRAAFHRVRPGVIEWTQ
jgi:beta-lactamase superfamily II metal-dependent hydrolase